jgi:hypothetical protein
MVDDESNDAPDENEQSVQNEKNQSKNHGAVTVFTLGAGSQRGKHYDAGNHSSVNPVLH